jgi:uncharacterized protein YpmB
MRKIIWIIIVFLLIITSLLTVSYIQAMKPLNLAKEEAERIALGSTDIVSVDAFEEYHGMETIWVVKGKNKEGVSLIVWIPESNDDELIVKKEADGIKAKDAVMKVKQLSEPKKIMDVRMGMEKGIPLWEIYYLSESNLINYYHIDFETGEWLKKIENL